MQRKVLLVEAKYKNKYPPMGLMKLATYFRSCGDDVRFYKGDLKTFAAELISEDLISKLEQIFPRTSWRAHYRELFDFVKPGKYCSLQDDVFQRDEVLDVVEEYRQKFAHKEYFTCPRFDVVCVTTLFTFYWKLTIETINFAKQLCKPGGRVFVGGIMASLFPNEIREETGIAPFVGQLSHAGDIDEGNDLIIDELPLDYSILDEIEYVYPAKDSYYAYMTRGCVNKCGFCAVPKLEPQYVDYIGLKKQIETTRERFGDRRDLLLLDNNVLASSCYTQIIEEIKQCGFQAGAMYIPPNMYEIAIRNLQDSYNDRAYIRKVVSLYGELLDYLDAEQSKELRIKLEEHQCLDIYTVTKAEIFALDDYMRPRFEAMYLCGGLSRKVDFNQGLDSRLINVDNMKIMSTINIDPLRIAFDHWNLRDTYERAIKSALSAGIRHVSCICLYNYKDTPAELYYRLRLNITLSEELNVIIYSFPMRFMPVFRTGKDEYFKNRKYIGEHWNKKFVSAIQTMTVPLRGVIGGSSEYFYGTFGRDIEEFEEMLWMPTKYLMQRQKYDSNLRMKLANKYKSLPNYECCDLANEWRAAFNALTPEQREIAKLIIAKGIFGKQNYDCEDQAILGVLKHYENPSR